MISHACELRCELVWHPGQDGSIKYRTDNVGTVRSSKYKEEISRLKIRDFSSRGSQRIAERVF